MRRPYDPEHETLDNSLRFRVDDVSALGLKAAIILQRVKDLAERNQQRAVKEFYRDERWWLKRSMEDWEEDIGTLSQDAISGYLKRLENLGLLLTSSSYNEHPTIRTKWYTIDDDAYQRFSELWIEMDEPLHRQRRKPHYKAFLAAWEKLRKENE